MEFGFYLFGAAVLAMVAFSAGWKLGREQGSAKGNQLVAELSREINTLYGSSPESGKGQGQIRRTQWDR